MSRTYLQSIVLLYVRVRGEELLTEFYGCVFVDVLLRKTLSRMKPSRLALGFQGILFNLTNINTGPTIIEIDSM
jgi:hypothetical protein